MHVSRSIVSYVASIGLCVAWGCVAMAQETPAVKAFHPAGPLPSYEVATIKPANPPSTNAAAKLGSDAVKLT